MQLDSYNIIIIEILNWVLKDLRVILTEWQIDCNLMNYDFTYDFISLLIISWRS